MHKTTNPALRRRLTLPLVTLYGLGNILGAGVYVLIGKVAGEAGYFAPVSFLMAGIIAAITAFSFAELSSRYPLSGGEAVYVQKAFDVKQLSLTVGLLIIITGIVSAATLTRGFLGYLQVFIVLPDWLVILCLLALLGLIAIWGIFESVSAAALFTLIEIGGLIFILFIAAPAWEQLPQRLAQFTPGWPIDQWSGIVGGAFLAFYAYVGFEDMVNVAEEVKQPQRNLPIAILLALGLATVLYLLVAVSALLVLSPSQLSQTAAPLATLYEAVSGNKPWLIAVISLFAVVNGALIQIIMASRVCYGLARLHWLPYFLSAVNARTQTPVYATFLVTSLIMLAAIWLPIETLARTTTYLLLIVSSLINLALVRIKRRQESVSDIFEVSIGIPITGFFVSVIFLSAQTISLLLD
jgi:APA family basic amino acid/polyamine antiporter